MRNDSRLKNNIKAYLIGIRDRFTTLSIMAFTLNNEAWIYNILIPIIKGEKLSKTTASIFHDYINNPKSRRKYFKANQKTISERMTCI